MKWESGRIFAASFGIALCGGWFVQFVLLPVLMPGIHAGHGLLLGGDWVGFHADGAKLAQQIAREGWGQFELRPKSNAPVAIAGAVYFLTGVHEPWILVPLHAVVFALGAVALYNIYRILLPAGTPELVSVAGIVFYLLFPTSLLMYSQIHKDVWTVTGFFGFVYVWIALDRIETIRVRDLLSLVAIAAVSTASIWLHRPYLVQITLITFAGATAFLLLCRLVFGAAENIRRASIRWIGMGLCLATLHLFSSALPGSMTELADATERATYITVTGELTLAPNYDTAAYSCEYEAGKSWLPHPAVRVLNSLRLIRIGQRSGGTAAGSAIDHEVCFQRPEDVLAYVPRAMQIGLFAPFPTTWFDRGATPGAGAMRLVSSLETAVTYVMLLGFLPLWLLIDRDARRNVGMIAAVAGLNLVVLATAIPNIGTLYRMRFGYIHILIGLGAIGWAMMIAHLRKQSFSR